MDPSLGAGPLGLIENGDVLFEGDHIVAVGQHLSAEHANVINGKGKIVMPGFVRTTTTCGRPWCAAASLTRPLTPGQPAVRGHS